MLRYFLVAALALFPLVASAQPAKPFKVRWYGQSFFQIETPLGKKVVTDPHQIPAFGRPVLSADIITVSHNHNDHGIVEVVEGHKSARIFRGVKDVKGRAEWEKFDEKVGAIKVRSLPSYHDNENGFARGKNSIFLIEAESITFCHLGDLGHDLTDDQIKLFGKIDVLMVPIGGTYTINGEVAKKLVERLKPRLYVLPMHYGVPNYDDLNGPEEFLDGQKLKVTKVLASNEVSFAADAKPDAPTIVLLGTGDLKKK